MPKPALLASFAMAAFALLGVSLTPIVAGAVPIISPGAPTTAVPTYLTDGSYWFGIIIPTPLPPNEFLLPVEISGAANLQNWQFDLLFDNTVVNEVDPLDGTSGIYGAEFTSSDLSSLSFILSGFPFNFLGEVDTVAGSYPSLLTGPSSNGPLAFILFECLDPANCNPTFGIRGAPEPATLLLLASGLVLLGGGEWVRRGRRHWFAVFAAAFVLQGGSKLPRLARTAKVRTSEFKHSMLGRDSQEYHSTR